MLTQPAPSPNTVGYRERRRALDQADPLDALSRVADHLASHRRGPMRDWLADHPRSQQAFIPVGAAWLNRIDGWWRRFRRQAFAGESLANADDMADVTRLATAQLNRHAQPGVWGRPPPQHRRLRRRFVYVL